jgi:hypothetical protein
LVGIFLRFIFGMFGGSGGYLLFLFLGSFYLPWDSLRWEELCLCGHFAFLLHVFLLYNLPPATTIVNILNFMILE